MMKWAVEARGVLLINPETGATEMLGYPQAAIWDFLTRGESTERIAAKMCAIASLEPTAARVLVEETVAAFQEAGWLTSH